MGVSGCILKRKEDIDIEQLIEDIHTAAVRANLYIKMNEKVFSEDTFNFKYVTFNLYDTNKEDNILLYLFGISDEDYEEKFDWIIKGGKLIHIINIEDFDSYERLMLDFLYEYLSINKNDIFWDEEEWFYDYNAIKCLKTETFDSEWCYKPFYK